jgi:hypothetical protein
MSRRSLILGLTLVVALAVGGPYTRNILGSSLFDGEYLPFGVVWPVAMMVMLLHPLLRRFAERWNLTEADVAIVFIMGITATTVTSDGLTAFLLSNIGAPYYGATQENRWLDYFGPHLHAWIVPIDRGNSVTWLFAGKPESAPIPWDAWFVPLFWWLSLFGATFWVCTCVVVLLRKQWVEHERLVFPLMEVPLELARGIHRPPFWKKLLFWWGAIPTCFVVLWNMIRFFEPGWPEIANTFGNLEFGPAYPAIRLHFWYPIIGFAYFVNLDVLASVWFFHLLTTVETGIMNRFGYSTGTSDIYCSASHAVGWQGFGALVMLVLMGLYMARGHLWRAYLTAREGTAPGRRGASRLPEDGRDTDDRDELFSYRTAILGAILGIVYLAAWLWRSGMDPEVVAVFLVGTWMIYVGLTRIVIQTGLVFVRAPMTAQSFTTSMLGPANMSASSLTAVAVSFSWVHTVFFFMPAMAHAAKLHHDLKLNRKHVVAAVALALAVAVPVSIYVTLLWGYGIGGDNFKGWAFGGGKLRHYDSIVAKMTSPTGMDSPAVWQLLIGAAAMWLLMALTHRVPGWPIHPIGLTIGYTHPTAMIAFSVFIAWAAKALLIRLGGGERYERTKPLFLGLIIGYFTGLAVAFFVDLFYFGPGNGHGIYSL